MFSPVHYSILCAALLLQYNFTSSFLSITRRGIARYRSNVNKALKFPPVYLRLVAITVPITQLKAFSSDSNKMTNSIAKMRKILRGKGDLSQQINFVLNLHRTSQVSEAITGYEVLIEDLLLLDNVNRSILLSMLANISALYLSINENENALKHLLKAIELSPDDANANFNLALCYHRTGAQPNALKYAIRSMKLNDKSYKTFHLLGNILQNMGRESDAQKYFLIAEQIAAEESQEESPQKAYSNHAFQSIALFNKNIGDSIEISHEGKKYEMKCISKSPLIFSISDFLSSDECDTIIAAASDKLEKSFAMGSKFQYDEGNADNKHNNELNSCESNLDEQVYRSSYTAWLTSNNNPLLAEIQDRLSKLLNISADYIKLKSEDLQVVKYDINGQFKAHQDSSQFHKRLLTALVYLNSPTAAEADLFGGETWFPYANRDDAQNILSVETAVEEALTVYHRQVETDRENNDMEVDKHSKLPGLLVRPEKGNAVIFFNYNADAQIDPKAVHAGLPLRIHEDTTHGGSDSCTTQVESHAKKWIANYWIGLDLQLLEEK